MIVFFLSYVSFLKLLRRVSFKFYQKYVNDNTTVDYSSPKIKVKYLLIFFKSYIHVYIFLLSIPLVISLHRYILTCSFDTI